MNTRQLSPFVRRLHNYANRYFRDYRVLLSWPIAFIRNRYVKRIPHYRDIEFIAGFKLFDSDWYFEQNPDVAEANADPLVHYLNIGAAEGRDPHPLFDSGWYLEQNPDIVEAGVNPLIHYLSIGATEGRDPSPLFDSDWYLEQYRDVVETGLNPLVHYLQVGAMKGYNPHPLFDSDWYLQHNPDVADTGMNPLVHYLTAGAIAGRNPSPNFDTRYYCSHYRDVWLSGLNPLEHYALIGLKEGRVANHSEFAVYDYSSLSSEPAHSQNISFPVLDHDPDASIIIPVLGDDLGDILNCLYVLSYHKSNYSFDVTVVYHCSQVDMSAKLSSIPGLRCVCIDTPKSFIAYCNHGVKLAKGKYLIFLNSDSIVLPAWLDALLDTYHEHPEAGLVGSKAIFSDGRLQEAGGAIWQNGSVSNIGWHDDESKPQYNYVRSVDYSSSNLLSVPRTIFKALGGFDELFAPSYCEDVDLAFKVRAFGKKVFYQPFSCLICKGNSDLDLDLALETKARQDANLKHLMNRWQEEISQHPPSQLSLLFPRNRDIKGRVLIIDENTPTPDEDAGSMVTMDWLLALRAIGYELTYIPARMMSHAGPYTERLQKLGSKCLYKPFVNSVEEYLLSSGNLFDLVLVFRIDQFSRYISLIRKFCPDAKVIFHTIDLHCLRRERESKFLHQAKIDEIRKLKELEFNAIKQADRSILVSPYELEIVQNELTSNNISVVPLTAHIAYPVKLYKDRKDIVFVGNYEHAPNIDAVLFFIEKIFPLVKQFLPEVCFRIVGRNPPEQILNLAGPNIIVAGKVDDLFRYFEQCRVSIAPIRYGAGMKGKIFSSASNGLPCVATSIAVEGIGLTDGKNIMIADTPEELAEKLVAVYTNETLWQSLSRNGIEFMSQNYSSEITSQKIHEVIEKLRLTSVTLSSGKSSICGEEPSFMN